MRRIPTGAVVCCVFVWVVLGIAEAKDKTAAGGPTGTYTNVTLRADGVFGQEVTIVSTRKGYEGVLQISEGTPGELMVVDVQIEGKRVTFAIPKYPDYPSGGKFVGTLEGSQLRGEFQSETAGTQNVTLKKGKGHCD